MSCRVKKAAASHGLSTLTSVFCSSDMASAKFGSAQEMSRESISGCEKRPVSRPAMAVAPWAWTYLTATELFSAGCKFCLLQLWSKSEPTKRTKKHRHNVRSELENTLISVRFCMHLKTCSRMLQVLGIIRRQWKTPYHQNSTLGTTGKPWKAQVRSPLQHSYFIIY